MTQDEKNAILAEAVAKGEEAAKASTQVTTVTEKAAIFEQAYSDAKHNTDDAKLKVAKFFKASIENDTATLKDLSEGVDANGGYIVPTEFSGMLIERKYKAPVIRQFAKTMPMASDKLELPVAGNSVSVAWVAELATISQSDPTFASLTLSPNMVSAISRVSRQLLADAAVNVGVAEYVIGEIAGAINRAEDSAFMVGTGTGQPKGIRTYSITQSVAQAAASLAGDDLINLYYALPIQYRDNAVFIMHDNITKLVRKLKDSSGRYLWSDSFDNGNGGLRSAATYPTLLGRPVIIQNDIPVNLGAGTNESEVFFGDLSYYIIGDREGISSEVSTQEGTSFASHRAALKVTKRVDGQLSLVEAFAKLTAVK